MSWNFTASHRGFACKGGPALSQICDSSKYTATGRRRIYNARNTLFLVVADFAAPEIHYFWLSQSCNSSKYTATGRRRFATTRRCV